MLGYIKRLFKRLFKMPFAIEEASPHPFAYDLHFSIIPGNKDKAWVCLHGSSGDFRIGHFVKKNSGTADTVFSFNLPDYGIHSGTQDPEKTTFGSHDEILPALYVLKKCVVTHGFSHITLYGFSAGGGAIINILSILNKPVLPAEVKKIGFSENDRLTIFQAILKGRIILDAPLKSVAEILALQGPSQELEIVEARYKKNNMVPIEQLLDLKNLMLHITVHFQIPDEVLSNRDDDLYVERLRSANAQGTTLVIKASDGGHSAVHTSLWNALRMK